MKTKKTEDQEQITALRINEEEAGWFDEMPEGHDHTENDEFEMKSAQVEADKDQG